MGWSDQPRRWTSSARACGKRWSTGLQRVFPCYQRTLGSVLARHQENNTYPSGRAHACLSPYQTQSIQSQPAEGLLERLEFDGLRHDSSAARVFLCSMQRTCARDLRRVALCITDKSLWRLSAVSGLTPSSRKSSSPEMESNQSPQTNKAFCERI